VSRLQVPAGFVRVDLPHASAVVRAGLEAVVREALSPPPATLHGWAGGRPDARALQGRGVAWAIELPGTGIRAVVRHNRHGGLLAPLTGDRFLAPTRAPYELDASLRLARRDVETPPVLAIVTYPAGLGVLARSDVATEEIAGSRDLGAVLLDTGPGDVARAGALEATRELLVRLTDAGARHHDLNVKNVLLAGDGRTPRAVLLDVDRVTFHRPGSRGVQAGNAARLRRSLDKWTRVRGASVTADDLRALFGAATA
jgi:3-deoxy-D-manno-octulosonic acid kinase